MRSPTPSTEQPSPGVIVRVPASTSNLGAGFDFLGIALDLWLEARLAPGRGQPVYHGTLARLDPLSDVVARLLGNEIPPEHHLELSSRVPLSRGLGSSAAATVAGLVLLELLRGREPVRTAIFRRGAELEGHPDNVAPATFGGLVLSAAHPTRLDLHPCVGLALAVPDARLDTQHARAVLPDQVTRTRAVEQARRAAALVQGLVSGQADLITLGMEDQLAVPHRSPLIRGFAAAVAAGRRAGAHGVTISGSGSAVLAIAPVGYVQAVADAMVRALAAAGNPASALTPAVSGHGFVVVDP